jgi:hypothetical protein
MSRCECPTASSRAAATFGSTDTSYENIAYNRIAPEGSSETVHTDSIATERLSVGRD